MHPVVPLLVAALLFGMGVYGVLVRRNAVLLLMSVELLLNAVNLILVTADATVRAAIPEAATGTVFALFIIVLAAAEIGVGLAIILRLYRMRQGVAVDEVPLTEPSSDAQSAQRPSNNPMALAGSSNEQLDGVS